VHIMFWLAFWGQRVTEEEEEEKEDEEEEEE
jgi:hypothetical protein